MPELIAKALDEIIHGWSLFQAEKSGSIGKLERASDSLFVAFPPEFREGIVELQSAADLVESRGQTTEMAAPANAYIATDAIHAERIDDGDGDDFASNDDNRIKITEEIGNRAVDSIDPLTLAQDARRSRPEGSSWVMSSFKSHGVDKLE